MFTKLFINFFKEEDTLGHTDIRVTLTDDTRHAIDVVQLWDPRLRLQGLDAKRREGTCCVQWGWAGCRIHARRRVAKELPSHCHASQSPTQAFAEDTPASKAVHVSLHLRMFHNPVGAAVADFQKLPKQGHERSTEKWNLQAMFQGILIFSPLHKLSTIQSHALFTLFSLIVEKIQSTHSVLFCHGSDGSSFLRYSGWWCSRSSDRP